MKGTGCTRMSPDSPQSFADLAPDPSWSFADCTAAQTGYLTHCYHRYPAKFIPQVAARLIREHSEPGGCVLDPFMGSGTTLVEALVNGRRARGIDINPAAVIASRAKTRAIEPARLRTAIADLLDRISSLEGERRGRPLFSPPEPLMPPNQERLDFWFPRDQQRRLGIVLAAIEATVVRPSGAEMDPSRRDGPLPIDAAVRDFLRCAFSHCLKTASYWLMKSSKPTRDKKKVADGVTNPLRPLRQHLGKMERANAAFWNALPADFRGKDGGLADVRRGDARQLPWPDASVDLAVTSPPYVTSYEYADLHELTALWLGGVAELTVSKADFIGSAASRRERGLVRRATVGSSDRAPAEGESPARLDKPAVAQKRPEANSELGRRIVAALREKSESKAEEARQYFLDMQEVFGELRRVLVAGGKVCNVIGNTALEGVEILNAEVQAEILASLGFEMAEVIRRVIPLKTLPQVRDPKSGKFTSAPRSESVEAYPEEFILIAVKRWRASPPDVDPKPSLTWEYRIGAIIRAEDKKALQQG